MLLSHSKAPSTLGRGILPKLQRSLTPLPAPLQPPALAQRHTNTTCPPRKGHMRALHAGVAAPTATDNRTAKQAYAELLEVAKRAAAAGAAVIMANVDEPRSVEYKGATDLVTNTDKASEEAVLKARAYPRSTSRILLPLGGLQCTLPLFFGKLLLSPWASLGGKVIQEAFPNHAILGEEGGVFGDTSSEYLWAVDPLDGTTNFFHAYPSFATSVGVLRGGVPVAGVVVEFAGGRGSWVQRTYSASRGSGAFLGSERIGVSQTSELQRALLVTGFGYEHDEAWAANLELFKHFTDVTQGVRRLGAAAVDLCHVALGIVDGYWEYRLKPWDVAAGVLIAEEAGALVTTMEGKPFSVFSRSVLAANTAVHGAVLERTRATTEGLAAGGMDLSPWFVPEGYCVKAITDEP